MTSSFGDILHHDISSLLLKNSNSFLNQLNNPQTGIANRQPPLCINLQSVVSHSLLLKNSNSFLNQLNNPQTGIANRQPPLCINLQSVVSNSLLEMAIAVSSAIRRCSLRLARLFRLRPHPSLGHVAFPPEIIFMIMAYLNKTSIMSLSLTCRTLFRICFPQSLELSRLEKEDFLLLLEKDVAHLYFCHHCVKLHRWSTSWFHTRNFEVLIDLCFAMRCREESCFSNSSTYRLPYPSARVVMNRHFYGAAHGVPASKLDGRGTKTDIKFGVKVCGTTYARIIDDQLILLSVLTISQSQGDAKLLREFIDQRGPIVCHHLHTATWSKRSHIHRVPEIVMNNSLPDYFISCSPSIKSCIICMTDYCIDISWHGRRKGWIIKIVTYRQLGAVRSPFHWTWSSILYGLSQDGQRWLDPSRYRPGFLRHMWSKADDVLLEPGGEWVGEPLA
jgi:hypothetical protein